MRYRHTDNDLVRSARQQDFLREARQKLPPETLIRERNELLDIFTKYTTSDIGDAVPLLELLKTFVGVQSAPVLEVHFPADLGDGTSGYVTASQSAIKKAVAQFLDTEGTPGERPSGEASPPDSGNEQGPEEAARAAARTSPARTTSSARRWTTPPHRARSSLIRLAVKKRKDGKPMIDFPIYYPTRLVPGSTLIDEIRAPSRSTAPTRTSTTATRWSPRTSARAASTSTTASRAPTGSTRRSSTTRGDADDRRPGLLALLRRRPAAPGRLEDQGRRLLGRQHAAAVARRGRRCSRSRPRCASTRSRASFP